MRIVGVLLMAIVLCVVGGEAQSLKRSALFVSEDNVHFSEGLEYKLDSSYTFISNQNNWNVSSKTVYVYDEHGYVLSKESYKFEDTFWLKNHKELNSYSIHYSTWDKEGMFWNEANQRWTKAYKKRYEIDESTGELDIVNWDWINDAWQNMWRQVQNYNDRNQLVSYQTVKWDEEINGWANYWDYNRFYNEDDQLLQVSHRSYDKVKGEWQDEWECINDFTGGQLRTEQILDWNEEGAIWDAMHKIEISYPEVNTVVKVKENWNKDKGEYITNTRTSEILGKDGNVIERVSEYWNEDQSTWNKQRKELLTYERGMKISEETLYWNASIDNWSNSSKKEYYYSQIELEEETKNNNYDLIVFPTPAESEIYLKYLGEANQLKVYNIGGSLVLQDNIPMMGKSINISDLKPGVYIAVLSFEDGYAKCKFIKK